MKLREIVVFLIFILLLSFVPNSTYAEEAPAEKYALATDIHTLLTAKKGEYNSLRQRVLDKWRGKEKTLPKIAESLPPVYRAVAAGLAAQLTYPKHWEDVRKDMLKKLNLWADPPVITRHILGGAIPGFSFTRSFFHVCDKRRYSVYLQKSHSESSITRKKAEFRLSFYFQDTPVTYAFLCEVLAAPFVVGGMPQSLLDRVGSESEAYFVVSALTFHPLSDLANAGLSPFPNELIRDVVLKTGMIDSPISLLRMKYTVMNRGIEMLIPLIADRKDIMLPFMHKNERGRRDILIEAPLFDFDKELFQKILKWCEENPEKAEKLRAKGKALINKPYPTPLELFPNMQKPKPSPTPAPTKKPITPTKKPLSPEEVQKLYEAQAEKYALATDIHTLLTAKKGEYNSLRQRVLDKWRGKEKTLPKIAESLPPVYRAVAAGLAAQLTYPKHWEDVRKDMLKKLGIWAAPPAWGTDVNGWPVPAFYYGRGFVYNSEEYAYFSKMVRITGGKRQRISAFQLSLYYKETPVTYTFLCEAFATPCLVGDLPQSLLDRVGSESEAYFCVSVLTFGPLYCFARSGQKPFPNALVSDVVLRTGMIDSPISLSRLKYTAICQNIEMLIPLITDRKDVIVPFSEFGQSNGIVILGEAPLSKVTDLSSTIKWCEENPEKAEKLRAKGKALINKPYPTPWELFPNMQKPKPSLQPTREPATPKETKPTPTKEPVDKGENQNSQSDRDEPDAGHKWLYGGAAAFAAALLALLLLMLKKKRRTSL